jgi:Rho GTPase-activating protein RGD1
MQETQAMRQEYFNFQLPRILRVSLVYAMMSTEKILSSLSQSLKEGADEIDNGLQYHLGRYAFLFESLLHTDGYTLAPLESDASMCMSRSNRFMI